LAVPFFLRIFAAEKNIVKNNGYEESNTYFDDGLDVFDWFRTDRLSGLQVCLSELRLSDGSNA
jgi:hypothetical protein